MRISSICSPAVATAALALIAGCGGGTTTVIEHKTVTGSARNVTTTGTQPTSSTTTTTPSTTSGTTPTSAGRTVHRATFESPTRNIGCQIVGGLARCDIRSRSWSPPPRPSSCPKEVDFGQGLEVGRSGSGRFVCAGDTALDPSAPELPYGVASAVGGFRCVSQASGMTCTNAAGGGFFISRDSYRAF